MIIAQNKKYHLDIWPEKNITRVDLNNSVKYSFILYNILYNILYTIMYNITYTIMYNILFIWENYYFQYINLKMYLMVVQNMLEFKKNRLHNI